MKNVNTITEFGYIHLYLFSSNNCFVEAHFLAMIPKNINYLILSFGGVGTSFTLRFFSRYQQTNHPDNADSLKHLGFPPQGLPPHIKVVYIYGNPAHAAISLFRRNLHASHSYTMNKTLGKTGPTITKEMTLEQFTENGTDLFHFREHFFNWYHADIPNPILFIRYETMYQNLPALIQFMDLPDSAIRYFPPQRQRKSSDLNLPEKTLERIEGIYQPFIEELNQIEPIVTRNTTLTPVPGFKSKLQFFTRHYLSTLRSSMN